MKICGKLTQQLSLPVHYFLYDLALKKKLTHIEQLSCSITRILFI